MHNVDTMMYVGEKPWHQLGTQLPNLATAKEALEAAKLTWEVKKETAYQKVDGNYKEVEGSFFTVRQDTHEILGIVGSRYVPLQNKEAFSFFDAVVGIKEAIYETAGSLGKGEAVWMLAKLNGQIKLVDEDIINKYVLLSNRHDGKAPVTIKLTPIRVVCQNTLNGALNGEGKTAKIRHSLSLGLKLEEVREQLGIINSMYANFEKLAAKLTTTKVTTETINSYLERCLIGKEIKSNEPISTRTINIVGQVRDLFNGLGKGSKLKSSKGTAWGAYNAITEYVDFYRGTRDTGDEQSNRIESILFTSGSAIKERAWKEAVALLS